MSNILVGVTGSISAYKMASVVSVLVDNGHNVRVIMTKSAKDFITPLTLSSLSKQPVFDDEYEFKGNHGQICHIDLAKWADIFVVAPMTANTGSKILQGIGDNLLTSTILAYTKSLLMFPAMNVHMWENFRKRFIISGYTYVYILLHQFDTFDFNCQKRLIFQPATGKMACGDVGEGKLVDTKIIINVIERMVKNG